LEIPVFDPKTPVFDPKTGFLTQTYFAKFLQIRKKCVIPTLAKMKNSEISVFCRALKLRILCFVGPNFSKIQPNLSLLKGQIIFANKQSHLILQAVHGIGYVPF
jgi:hypothetical protein